MHGEASTWAHDSLTHILHGYVKHTFFWAPGFCPHTPVPVGMEQRH